MTGLDLRAVCVAMAMLTPFDASSAGAGEELSIDALRAAVDRSLPLLETGARGALQKRKQCFTCHNQGLPILALTTAESRGFKIDKSHLDEQLKFTAEFLGKNKSNYQEGKGQGGQVDTAGYALWALAAGTWPSDETTTAVVEYLLRYQGEQEHWTSSSRRPPSEQSLFTTTFLALRGLKRFGTSEQQERIDARVKQVAAWLVKTPAVDTEDRVFRLRALEIVGATDEQRRSAGEELVKSQREDGGWGQLADLASDAYATGSVLVALHESGGLPTDDPVYRKGLSYLVSVQMADGSWHVTSRSKPFQAYFESGYPHGKDQFISIAAAGWATTALALALPKAEK